MRHVKQLKRGIIHDFGVPEEDEGNSTAETYEEISFENQLIRLCSVYQG